MPNIFKMNFIPIKCLFLFLVIFFVPVYSFSQGFGDGVTDAPPNGAGGIDITPNSPEDDSVPIDNGLCLLLISGIGFGVHQLRNNKAMYVSN